MTGAIKTPKEIKRAATLRLAGYSLAAIAEKTDISVSTLQRHFARHGVGRGTIPAAAIEAATQELLRDAGFIDGLRAQIASQIIDDLAHTRRLREAIALSLEKLADDHATPEPIKARAYAAYATAIKAAQDTARKALGMDRIEIERDALPELPIRDLTGAEIAELRHVKAAGIKTTEYDTEEVF